MSTNVVINANRTIRCSAAPLMHDDLSADLHEFGFYEIFAAAEQLWAINVGLAPRVADWKAPNIHSSPRRLIRGLRVRLTETLRTNGGTVFKAGRIMQIDDRRAGLFTLKTLRRPQPVTDEDGQSINNHIRKVYPGKFVIVSEREPRP